MSEAAHEWSGEVDDLDPAALLAALGDTETRVRRAETDKLRLALQWCALHRATSDTGVASWAGPYIAGILEQDESLGGDGTPAVAAFAAEPFAAALGVSSTTGMQVLADALDLAHRLPQVWARVQSLAVPVWKARKVAQATHGLSREAAAYVDDKLATRIASVGYPTITRLVAEAVARFDPPAQETKEEAARANHGVELWPRAEGGYAGDSELRAVGDTLDLTKFHDLITDLAHRLQAQGDTDPLGVLKIKAMGMLADGQGAFDLRDGDPVEQSSGSATSHLFLHLDSSDIEGEDLARTATVERLGPATRQKILDWLRLSNAVITPVIRPDRVDAVDAHDPPWWMAEQVILRDRTCRFPWCGQDARRCDLDHIVPYDPGGPPGQTSPENLAPLCRRHHRAKTAGRWRYRRLPDGTYQWHGPWQTTYVVTPHSTHPVAVH